VTVFVVSGRAVGRGRELGVAASPAPARGYDYPLSRYRKIVDELARLRLRDKGAYGDRYDDIFAVAAVTIAALSVAAATSAIFWIEPELQESVELGGRFHEDRAAAPPVAARRAAARDEFLAAESRNAVAPVAASYNNLSPI
jgi:hypothetical protein